MEGRAVTASNIAAAPPLKASRRRIARTGVFRFRIAAGLTLVEHRYFV
jgi:hypothetical protein